MIILIVVAFCAIFASVVISWYGIPGDRSAVKNGTVKGSILSDVPREAEVSEPEKEPDKLDEIYRMVKALYDAYMAGVD